MVTASLMDGLMAVPKALLAAQEQLAMLLRLF
jgi:hypothetical protein